PAAGAALRAGRLPRGGRVRYRSVMAKRGLWVAVMAAMAAAAAGASRPSVTVAASEIAAPCVRAAARGWTGSAGLCVGRRCGAQADVVVLSAVEMNRALESGQAVDGSDLDVARVPWVLAVRGDSPEIRSLGDLARDEHDVR